MVVGIVNAGSMPEGPIVSRFTAVNASLCDESGGNLVWVPSSKDVDDNKFASDGVVERTQRRKRRGQVEIALRMIN